MSTRTVSEVRADRLAVLGRVLTALLAAVAYGVGWLVRRSWRRLLPVLLGRRRAGRGVAGRTRWACRGRPWRC